MIVTPKYLKVETNSLYSICHNDGEIVLDTKKAFVFRTFTDRHILSAHVSNVDITCLVLVSKSFIFYEKFFSNKSPIKSAKLSARRYAETCTNKKGR